ncbi:hypothetical protein MMC30_002862 [Trapelia coarctata]|nr:hypothetical protein [Trapelia coarctata]
MAIHSTKKRKRGGVPTTDDTLDTSKPTAVFHPGPGRTHTLSVALPGSIIANAQTHDLKSTLAGQIARALAVFCVDEVIIFDDGQSAPPPNSGPHSGNGNPENPYSGYSNPNYFLTHLLSYLECPPHLRIHLFPLHPDLRTAGSLPSLDMPHHLRAHEWCQYREGVTIQDASTASNTSEPHTSKKKKRKPPPTPAPTTLVNAGLGNPVAVDGSIPPYTRVTVKLPTASAPADFQTATLVAEAVAPSEPREQAGYYWGYTVRSASSLSTVFTECAYDGGYDLTFGTSERGVSLSELAPLEAGRSAIQPHKHMLIVFGGVAGLEAAVKTDSELVDMGVLEAEKLFDYWVNLCPGQGSRTIRTEEAVWLGLMGLRGVVVGNGTNS